MEVRRATFTFTLITLCLDALQMSATPSVKGPSGVKSSASSVMTDPNESFGGFGSEDDATNSGETPMMIDDAASEGGKLKQLLSLMRKIANVKASHF